MKAKVTCPACGADDLDVRAYDSLMALRADLALFTLTCPHCAARISALLTIPPQIESFGRPPREAARDAEARSWASPISMR